MKEEKWFSCAEFNAKTAENYRKHQQEKATALRIGQQLMEEERRQNRMLVLDLFLAGVMMIALGVLVGVLV